MKQFSLTKAQANLRERAKSLGSDKYSGGPRSNRFFGEKPDSIKFMDLFGVNSSNFEELYKIVTDGQGKESTKINSLRSSSLLSLLCFHRLATYPSHKNSEVKITIPVNGEDITFSKCFFEVRNRVINLPSNIDVALVSEDGSTLLFLESKFTEFAEGNYLKPIFHLKRGYHNLYSRLNRENFWADSEILADETEHALNTADGTSTYMEGIKQSISHLIGILRGPRKAAGGYYPDNYFSSYREAYRKAKRLIYGTILYNLTDLGGEYEFNKYINLFEKTIGSHPKELNLCIKDCFKECREKDVEIISTPLIYQNVFGKKENFDLLTNNIRKYYAL